MALQSEPRTSDEWVSAVVATLHSMDARRGALRDFDVLWGDPALTQRYQVASVDDDLDLEVTHDGILEVPQLRVSARVDDHIMGEVERHEQKFASVSDMVDWVLSCGLLRRVVKRVTVRVKVGGGPWTEGAPIGSMDAVLFAGR